MLLLRGLDGPFHISPRIGKVRDGCGHAPGNAFMARFDHAAGGDGAKPPSLTHEALEESLSVDC